MSVQYSDDRLMDYDEVMARFDVVLGLEVHVELNTESKMWCGCSTKFGAEPNTHTCPVCLGLPGALPVVNGKAVESAIRIGLSLGCSIASWCRFARKHYFYPDMPKNYQISQYDEPIAYEGEVRLDVEGTQYTVPIERAHMEEDAGKSLHVGGATGRIQGSDYSLMDYNRAGVPLIEIVTKPVYGTGTRGPEVARAYMSYLRDMVRALDVSAGRMEQGQLRCDANVSLMPKGSTELGTRTETKNVNSLRSVEAALRYEICRQGAVLADGGRVKQETRMWNESGGFTTAGRSKEEAEDYRYLPDPDLVPVEASAQWVDELRKTLPELPAVKAARLQKEWGLTDLEMRDIEGNEGALALIEATVVAGADQAAARKWWLGELSRRANETEVELAELPISPVQVAQVGKLVDSGKLTDKMARQVIEAVLAGEGEPAEIVKARGLEVVSDDDTLSRAVDEAIAANPGVADKIRGGKVQAAGALIGAVMKQMHGQADAARVRELILKALQ
ncbi:Aspartyl/glutamyl-tRNA(Asn/Gln) amidotransferase subunit B [Propionibacterium freudenreichii]|uniref:Aspartyl/glutamyl-tRNA(Asn/Gln) amidotransferase subunit B n=2 Tax=Propionibacterium freudenreichii TaxID=1744 RepID=A0A2C7YZD6_9ACTN|nr:Aspartyl/glutamyl-tRNA(Asn/Gln) amidotransferase subunit B [Propionibacterium freudenreichii subsp. freudenreichii]CEG89957.1 Aspartyl/glutamyl-tRNA(Asn/Gln) amidotransferase subunit B (Asp/Glu-ADT subunit B) [Propionibacterium freudenreichii]CUW13439.1 Aspartyl/glutamyl-tRNA(Asn/Gln) amidotransferase subunit B [Propionibacterium freudenreichii subsp. shermanii]CEH09685.1 Aspartyl/glutamyl-tRNA(Asn/Gln) amidotransferase subunit B (Asp/Glu-ADT subunit B) [Propionibacterium freudenreichii]CEI3